MVWGRVAFADACGGGELLSTRAQRILTAFVAGDYPFRKDAHSKSACPQFTAAASTRGFRLLPVPVAGLSAACHPRPRRPTLHRCGTYRRYRLPYLAQLMRAS